MPRRGRSLFDVIFALPNVGIGSHVTRTRWLKYPGTHWVITDVQPYARAADRAKVKGVFKFRDWLREPRPRRIRSQLKREWVLLYNGDTKEAVRPAGLSKDLAEQWEQEYFSKTELFQYPPQVPTEEEKRQAIEQGRLDRKQRLDLEKLEQRPALAHYEQAILQQAGSEQAEEQQR